MQLFFKILLIVDCAIAAGLLSLIFFRCLYPAVYKARKKKFDSSYRPTVSVFVPCKGIDRYFAENIKSFLSLKYEKLKFFFIVESEDDAAYPELKRLSEGDERSSLVIAGTAKGCGQKNHNLLKAFEKEGGEAEAYVFFDADIPISENWLENLLLPLSDEGTLVATGFRWFKADKKSIGEYLHAFMNAVQWNFINFIFFNGVWGGSMAIRRETLEKYNVKEYWARTVVDDMTMQHVVLKSGKRSVFVPECLSVTDDVIDNVPAAFAWFKRQALYVKYYLTGFWFLGLIPYSFISLSLLSMMALLPLSIIYGGAFTEFAVLQGSFSALAILWIMLLRRDGDDGFNPILWLLLSPFFVAVGSLASVASALTNTMVWRGIVYKLNLKGEVQKIIR